MTYTSISITVQLHKKYVLPMLLCICYTQTPTTPPFPSLTRAHIRRLRFAQKCMVRRGWSEQLRFVKNRTETADAQICTATEQRGVAVAALDNNDIAATKSRYEHRLQSNSKKNT